MHARRISLVPVLALALVVLPVASASAQGVLYDQYDNGSTATPYVESTRYCSGATDCRDHIAADDVFVPVGKLWQIVRIDVDGAVEPSDPPAKPGLLVRFYEDDRGRPGSVAHRRDVLPSQYSRVDGRLAINLQSVPLTRGRWWFSIQADVSQTPTCEPGCGYRNTQDAWRWRPRTVVSELPARVRRPGCSWCTIEDASQNPQDLVFSIRGTASDYNGTPVGQAKDQHMAVAPDGRAVFTWLRWNGANWVAQGRARAADGTLSAAQDLSAPGEDATLPQVAIDAQGKAVFVWRRWSGPNTVIQARTRSASGALSVTRNISNACCAISTISPRVGVDLDGDAVIGWLQGEDGHWIARARALDKDGILHVHQKLSSPGFSALDLELAVDPDGDAVFVWQRRGVVQTKHRASDGPISLVQNLASDAGLPDVGVDSAGNAIYSWHVNHDAQTTLLRTRRRAVDGTLSPTQFLGYSGGYADMDVNAGGAAVFVWESVGHDGDTRYVEINTRARAASGALSRTQTLTTPGEHTVEGEWPQVAVDAGGDAVFSWTSMVDAVDGYVRTRRRAQDGTLSAPQDVGFFEDSGGFTTNVGVDDTGNAVFAWLAVHDSAHPSVPDPHKYTVLGRSRSEGGAFSPMFTVSR